MNIVLFIFLLLFSRYPAAADEQPVPTEHFTRERSYHVVHYKLNIELDEKAKTCAEK